MYYANTCWYNIKIDLEKNKKFNNDLNYKTGKHKKKLFHGENGIAGFERNFY
jgi:hypothetical protein